MLNLSFAHPYIFLLLIPVAALLAWYILRNGKMHATMRVSALDPVIKQNSWKVRFRHVIYALRIIALFLIVVVLARPQTSNSRKNASTEGIDIVIAMDISSSMLAKDFTPDRLEASKEVATQFISGRPSDRIGLVVFSGESFTQCPLTSDHPVLINLFRDIKCGMITDGTAIGMGLATAVTRLKDSDAKSKVIILLTDGVNNSGSVAPLTAAEIAKTFGIRVYTIGVGTMGKALAPVSTPVGWQFDYVPVEIDEAILKQIANETGGKYFRATDNAKLRSIYSEIDKLEKSKIEFTDYTKRNDEYFWILLVAGILLIVEMVSRFTIFKTIP
ncbi:MAG TPA: VWA domain-containing protein [Bacteroidales bacterium]|nr:VWA domain-containing protein [Bacteroidales bacterium]